MKKLLPTCIAFFFPIWMHAQSLWNLHTWKNETTGNNVTAVYVGDDDKIWSGFFYRGLAHFDGNDWSYFDNNDYQKRVTSITQVSDGTYWFGGLMSLIKFDGDEWRYYDGQSYILTLVEYDDNVIWVGTNTGLYAFNKTEESFVPIPLGNDSALVVNCLYKDSQSRIWVGTNTKGVFVYQNGDWTDNYTMQNSEIPYNAITDVAERAGGEMWLATRNGTVRYRDGVWNVLPESDGMEALHVDNKQNLWMGGMMHVLKFDDIQLTDFTPAGVGVTTPTGGVAYRIDSDSECSVYFATNRGLSQLSDCMLMDLDEEKAILATMFPNPAASHLNIALAPEMALPATVRFMDMAGRVVKQVQSTAHTTVMEIGEIPPGVYVVSVKTAAGQEYVEKIIKQ